jgi:hypothetical protein
VQLVATVFAEPQKTIFLCRPVALYHQTYRIRRPLRTMRHTSWQQHHLAFLNRKVNYFFTIVHPYNYIAFQLVKQLLAFIYMKIAARVGAAHYHHDEIFITMEKLLVAHGRAKQVSVFLYPGVQVKRLGEGHVPVSLRVAVTVVTGFYWLLLR